MLVILLLFKITVTVKPVLSGHSKTRPKIDFQDQISLNAGQKYCILQYFQPSLSYRLSWRSLFCLLLSGCLRLVLLYTDITLRLLMMFPFGCNSKSTIMCLFLWIDALNSSQQFKLCRDASLVEPVLEWSFLLRIHHNTYSEARTIHWYIDFKSSTRSLSVFAPLAKFWFVLIRYRLYRKLRF